MAKYRFKTKPYRHQVDALKDLLNRGWGGALLMAPRTGKTKVCIDFTSIRHQQGHVNRALIVCPNTIIDVWIDEIALHCPFPYTITVWDRKARKPTKSMKRRGIKTASVELPKWGRTTLDFVIINYDAFSTPGAIKGRDEHGGIIRGRRGGRYAVINAFKKWKPQIIILDESHRIKTSSAKKSTAMHTLGKVADYRINATGTAVTKAKRTFDLYSQWKFLNPESPLIAGHTLATFRAEYGRWIRIPGENFDRFQAIRNPKRLHRLLHAESYAVTREECFDLPPNFPDQIIHVQLEESASTYDQMAEEMVARIRTGEITEASIRLVQSLRLSQITSGIARVEPSVEHPDGRLVRIGREKLRALEDLLVDWFEQEEKIVICARFRADIQGIAQVCNKLKVRPQLLYGGQSRQDRTRSIAQFRAKAGPAAFIMNPQAGSMGIDLRTASTMVWYSLTQSFVDYTQSRDRIALSGKANRFYFLLAEGTYDELQYASLQLDADVIREIHDSPERLLRNYRA